MVSLFGEWSPSEMQAVAALLTALLTGLIVLVYIEQIKLKKLERRPIIAAQAYKEHDIDSIAVQLKNYGHGSTTDIQVQTIISPIDVRVIENRKDRLVILWNNFIPRSASTETNPKAIHTDENLGNSRKPDSKDWNQPYGARIAPSESGVYRIELSVKTNPNILPNIFSRRWQQIRPWLPYTADRQNPNVKHFGAAFEKLQDSADHYRLKVLVRPQNEFGATETEIVFDYVIPAKRNLTVGSALEIGMPYEQFRNNREEYEARVLE